MGVRHTYQSATANNGAKEVSSTRWNDDHTITDLALSVITGTPSADQQDWAPTGWNDSQPNRAVIIRAQPSTVSYVGGLAGGANGRIAIIQNDTTDGLVCLVNEDTGSTASNRFALRREVFWVLPGQQVRFTYDSTAARWTIATYTLDPLILDSEASLILPNTTTSVQSVGIQTSNTATLSTTAPSGTPTNDFLARPSTQITNSTASGSSDVRGNSLNYMRGATARRQGFFFESTFRFTAASATGGGFVGLSNSTAAITTLPGATNNTIYCGIEAAGQTTLRIGSRDGATNNPTDLGANYPVPNATATYNVVFLAVPTQTRVIYAVRRLDAAFRTGGAISANLPSTTTGLAPRANVAVGGTGAATTLQFTRLFTRHLNY